MQSEDEALEAPRVLNALGSDQHGSSFSQEEWSDGDDMSVGNVSVEVRRLPMGENESGQKGEASPSESFDDDDFGFDEDGDSLAAKLSAKMAQTEADAGHSSDADSWDAEPDADKSFEMPSGLSHSGQMGSGMMTLIRSNQVKVDFTDQESSFAEEDDDFEFDASEDDDNVFQKMSSRMSRFTTSAPLEEPAVDDFDDVEEADEDTTHTVERPQKNKEKLTRDEEEEEEEEEGSDFEEGLSIGDEECFLGSRFSSSSNNNNIGSSIGSGISSSPYSLSLESLQQRRPLNEAMTMMMKTMKTTKDNRGSSKDFEEKAKRYDSLVAQMEVQMKALHEIPIGQMLSRNEDEAAGSAAVDEEEEEEEDLERERRLGSAVSRMKATLQEAEKRRQDLDHSLQEKVAELRALQSVKKRIEKQIERQLNGQAETCDDGGELGVEQEVQEEEAERKTSRTSESFTFVVGYALRVGLLVVVLWLAISLLLLLLGEDERSVARRHLLPFSSF